MLRYGDPQINEKIKEGWENLDDELFSIVDEFGGYDFDQIEDFDTTVSEHYAKLKKRLDDSSATLQMLLEMTFTTRPAKSAQGNETSAGNRPPADETLTETGMTPDKTTKKDKTTK